MTDQQPTESTPTTELHTAPAPPALQAAPPPPRNQWAPPPAAAPSPSRARASGPPIRTSVAAVAVFALLAVVGAIVWDGGSSNTSGPTGPTGPAGSGTQVPIPGSSGPSDEPSSSGNSTASPKAPSGPLDPTDLGPSGASMTPTERNALLQWRLQGNWMDQIATYRASFPGAGYEMYREEGARTTNEAGEAVAIAYEVVPLGAEYYDSVGYIQFEPDPDDPQGSTYLTWRTSL